MLPNKTAADYIAAVIQRVIQELTGNIAILLAENDLVMEVMKITVSILLFISVHSMF